MMRLYAHISRFELTPRNHAAVMREVNRNVMVRHQYERLPRHFEEVAYSEYQARPRTSKYIARKQKKFGHNRPNIYTGRLRKSVLNKVKITATQHVARLTTSGTTRSRLQNWQLREIQTISDAEQALENKRMARDYKRMATSAKYARKRKKRTV
jgi:hypothetical protein